MIHQSKVGTFHPDPKADPAWTVNDTCGYADSGPACDECGACECECPECGTEGHLCEHYDCDTWTGECVGLSFAFVCLDGGEALCRACAAKAGIKIKECDCP